MSTLTTDQEKAAQAFFTFLMKGDSIFVLSGGAGVGKTYMMEHIHQNTMKTYEAACKLAGIHQAYDEVVFTATTNRAAGVLEEVIGKRVSTIHSYLNLKVTENHTTGETTLEKNGLWKQHSKKIVFIDESSMVDTTLYKIILETLPGCKIVFVGDHAQMAPIHEEVSPVYKDVAPENFIFLGVPIRNAESPALMALCKQLRETVETGIFAPIQEVPGVIEYVDDSQMQDALAHYFTKPTDKARVLCYTNSRVQSFNQHIRELRKLPEEFVVDEEIIFARAFATKTGTVISADREGCITSVGPLEADLDYENIFSDRKPITYHVCEINMGIAGNITVRIATDPDRLQQAIKHFAGKENWPAYFQLKNTYADIRIKDACTVYKAQGGTYETIFMDIGNIGISFDAKRTARMLFVGASRASTRIFLYGSLPGRYTGWT